MTDLESSSPATIDLVVRDLGRLAYAEGFALQKDLQRQLIERRGLAAPRAAGPAEMHLLLVEHEPPVITVTRRRGARQHLLATEEQLRAAGVEVAETDRGGDVTYHGPGQIVAYPILDLNVLGLRLHGYMSLLEQVIIETLARFRIEGRGDPSARGVWVTTPGGAASKICAMGVRISRWVSMHGLALNVDPNLDHFDLIVPCGLAGRTVTSMKSVLGDACPGLDEVKEVLVERVRTAVGAG